MIDERVSSLSCSLSCAFTDIYPSYRIARSICCPCHPQPPILILVAASLWAKCCSQDFVNQQAYGGEVGGPLRQRGPAAAGAHDIVRPNEASQAKRVRAAEGEGAGWDVGVEGGQCCREGKRLGSCEARQEWLLSCCVCMGSGSQAVNPCLPHACCYVLPFG